MSRVFLNGFLGGCALILWWQIMMAWLLGFESLGQFWGGP